MTELALLNTPSDREQRRQQVRKGFARTTFFILTRSPLGAQGIDDLKDLLQASNAENRELKREKRLREEDVQAVWQGAILVNHHLSLSCHMESPDHRLLADPNRVQHCKRARLQPEATAAVSQSGRLGHGQISPSSPRAHALIPF